MAKITNQEHQYNVDLVATEVVAVYINGVKAKEYTVGANNTARVTFMYQEMAE